MGFGILGALLRSNPTGGSEFQTSFAKNLKINGTPAADKFYEVGNLQTNQTFWLVSFRKISESAKSSTFSWVTFSCACSISRFSYILLVLATGPARNSIFRPFRAKRARRVLNFSRFSFFFQADPAREQVSV
jgi:hypothetical protein